MRVSHISLKEDQQYPISEKLWGIFLEDINFAVDGGLNANMVDNYSFDGVYMDPVSKDAVRDPLRYWKFRGAAIAGGNAPETAISANSGYAAITVEGNAVLENLGYNGRKLHGEEPAMHIAKNHSYEISILFRADSFEGSVQAEVIGPEDDPLTNMGLLVDSRGSFMREKTDLPNGWHKAGCILDGYTDGYGKLLFTFNGHGTILIDCVDLHDMDYWHAGDAKWSEGRMRRDLVEALAQLHPRFLRFPGGCIVEGMKAGNEYNWKDTIGQLWERRPNFNLWSEKIADGGYSQSYQIGFYEYFCLCEDLHMEPLPTLTAGLNCQIRAMQYHFREGVDVPVDSPVFQSYIVKNYLDLIDFATGDPETNAWAAKRAAMGHPEPFTLTMVGVGNENFGRDYLKRYDIITGAVHRNHPEIRCIQCGGFMPNQAALAPLWLHARKNHKDEFLDEHSYMDPAWFVRNAHRYDLYPRNTTKVYVGEYSANGVGAGAKLTLENTNTWKSALAEAAFMTGLERNGDVVEMASYAPLMNLVGCEQWYANLIDFNPAHVLRTANYYVQKLFSNYYGFSAVPFNGMLPPQVCLSVTQSEETLYLKTVNIGAEECGLVIEDVGRSGVRGRGERMRCDLLDQKNRMKFDSRPSENITPEPFTVTLKDCDLHLRIPAHSIVALALDR